MNKYPNVVNISMVKRNTSFASRLKVSLKKMHEQLCTNVYIHIIRQRFSETTRDVSTQPLADERSSAKRYRPPLLNAPLFADTWQWPLQCFSSRLWGLSEGYPSTLLLSQHGYFRLWRRAVSWCWVGSMHAVHSCLQVRATGTTIFGAFTRQKSRRLGKLVYLHNYSDCGDNN